MPQNASIVIPSYNYARFVGKAIDSALLQTRPPLEVIVVDDGSIDDSRAVIEGYGRQVRCVFKENGGHASAINAGCRVAQGDVVFLLDSDDELAPDAVETVLGLWRPDTVLVHYRPRMIDADGREIVGSVPAPWVRLDEGDLRQQMLRSGGFATTVTSGLVMRRDALANVLPIPEQTFTQGADGYLVRSLAFLGRVQAIDRPLSRYRRHGENDSEMGGSADTIAAALRKRIGFARNELELVRRLAARHGLQPASDIGEHDADYLFLRLASSAVDPRSHPLPGDTPLGLLPRLLAAELRAQSPLGRRLAAAALASAVVLLPQWARWRLLAWWHNPSARPGWLIAFATWRRRAVLR